MSDPNEEWRGTKQQKEALRAKFGGRCAYCGCELTAMQADHFEPVVRVPANPYSKPPTEARMLKPERNVVSNMMPACPACNMHKGGYDLESWRDIIQRSAEIGRRATSTFKAGERFGIITVTEQPVRFYFEKLSACDCDGAYPLYGVAPHECYWRKGPQFSLGQSTLLPITDQDCFVPDLENDEGWSAFRYPSACGIYYCPKCQRKEYEAAWGALVARIGVPPAQDPQDLGAQLAGPIRQDAPNTPPTASKREGGHSG